MSTIGNLSIVFTSDVKQLEDGIGHVNDMFDQLKKTVTGLSEQIKTVAKDSATISVKTDVSQVKDTVEDVKELSKEVEKSSPTVKINVSRSVATTFFREARGKRTSGVQP